MAAIIYIKESKSDEMVCGTCWHVILTYDEEICPVCGSFIDFNRQKIFDRKTVEKMANIWEKINRK